MAAVAARRSPVAALLANLGTTEQRLAAAIAVATALRALQVAPAVDAERRRETKLAEAAAARRAEAKAVAAPGMPRERPQRLPSTGRVQDHPLFTWLLSNGTVLGLLQLRKRLVPAVDPDGSQFLNLLKMWAGSVVSNDGAMALSYFYINYLYAHTPFFSEKRVKQTYKEILMDYLSCNTVINVVASIMQLIVMKFTRSGKSETVVGDPKAPFRPLRFLLQAIYFRVFIDAGFWAGHYLLHTKPFYWIHKKHHEHAHTKLTTNYHFLWSDLAIEAFLPFFFAAMAHDLFVGPLNEGQINLFAGYAFTYEIYSHAGKALPIMNAVAPLAPWFQRYDDRNPWAHEVHHRTLKYNLSISYWFDRLMGTDRWGNRAGVSPEEEQEESLVTDLE